ncbi:hypothetical protein RN001_006097 [Aquatica leii]|uniref:DUF4806 domain-containing protein n=1 Tax=Aquatica leii TaxID=1421715 RepID=A0AAN7SQ33_9COLE|nr:hypothetical protein RN001_006097 [Aquatica leii]
MDSFESNKYAVILFREAKQNAISVVPTNWVFQAEGHMMCSWPKTVKNVRTNIMKRVKAENDWPVYECSLYKAYMTYEQALIGEKLAAASSESEVESVYKRAEGKRRVRQKKIREYSPPPAFEQHSSSSGSSQTNTSNYITLENHEFQDVNNMPVILEDDNFHFPTGSVERATFDQGVPDNIGSQINHVYRQDAEIDQSVANNVDESGMHNLLVRKTDALQENINSVLNEVQEIKGIVRLILLKLNSSENYSKNEANICDDSLIRDLIPITCIENLLKFENTLLQNEEASKQLCNKLRLTGGTNPKNFTRRCLTMLMTNEVAALSSWTGQKQNFKIGDTELINILKKALRANYPTVKDKEFEVFVMDWLRFANQRKLKAAK